MVFLKGYPGWGWKMYGIAKLHGIGLWFLGFSKQIPSELMLYEDHIQKYVKYEKTLKELLTIQGEVIPTYNDEFIRVKDIQDIVKKALCQK